MPAPPHSCFVEGTDTNANDKKRHDQRCHATLFNTTHQRTQAAAARQSSQPCHPHSCSTSNLAPLPNEEFDTTQPHAVHKFPIGRCSSMQQPGCNQAVGFSKATTKPSQRLPTMLKKHLRPLAPVAKVLPASGSEQSWLRVCRPHHQQKPQQHQQQRQQHLLSTSSDSSQACHATAAQLFQVVTQVVEIRDGVIVPMGWSSNHHDHGIIATSPKASSDVDSYSPCGSPVLAATALPQQPMPALSQVSAHKMQHAVVPDTGVTSSMSQVSPAHQQQQPLLGSLRAWRQARAKQACKQPSSILPDAVLQALVLRKPVTFLELQEVPGLTAMRAHKLGQELLDLIKQQVHAAVSPCSSTCNEGAATTGPLGNGSGCSADTKSSEGAAAAAAAATLPSAPHISCISSTSSLLANNMADAADVLLNAADAEADSGAGLVYSAAFDAAAFFAAAGNSVGTGRSGPEVLVSPTAPVTEGDLQRARIPKRRLGTLAGGQQNSPARRATAISMGMQSGRKKARGVPHVHDVLSGLGAIRTSSTVARAPSAVVPAGNGVPAFDAEAFFAAASPVHVAEPAVRADTSAHASGAAAAAAASPPPTASAALAKAHGAAASAMPMPTQSPMAAQSSVTTSEPEPAAITNASCMEGILAQLTCQERTACAGDIEPVAAGLPLSEAEQLTSGAGAAAAEPPLETELALGTPAATASYANPDGDIAPVSSAELDAVAACNSMPKAGGGSSKGGRVKQVQKQCKAKAAGQGFLNRQTDAALKQYSRDEDKWILRQVASGRPEAEVAAMLRRSRNAIVRRVRLLIARAMTAGSGSGAGGVKKLPQLHQQKQQVACTVQEPSAGPSATDAAVKAEVSEAAEHKVGNAFPGPPSKEAGSSATGLDAAEAEAVRSILNARAAAALARSTTSLPRHLLDPLIECIKLGGSSHPPAQVPKGTEVAAGRSELITAGSSN